MNRALVLLNLGTPDDPGPEAVGRYLREFLMDGRVIDLAWPLRWLLVNCLIVPKRRFASSALYKSIWTERGSPLLVQLEDLARGMRQDLRDQNVSIFTAMRYGQPSLQSVFAELVRQGELSEVVVFPLYPQYAESTTLSSIEECQRVARETGLRAPLRFVNAFYEHPGFVQPMAEKVRASWQRLKPEHLLMSFHGLPESHVRRTDRSVGGHCLLDENCCNKIVEANRDCYRAQCFATARAIAQAAGLAPDEYSVAFQSRLGRAKWIGPATEDVIAELAKRGVRHLAVACPSFVADCLETIEEIGIRGAEVFHENGGETFTRIECLNSDPTWIGGAWTIFLETEQRTL